MKNWRNEKNNGSSQAVLTERGYVSLYIKHVEQSHLGADLDFLKGASGSEVVRDSH